MPSIQALQTFLDRTSIPTPPTRERTFLDISGFPHYELVISNWYAYFCKDTEDHGLGSQLIATLLELINEKKGSSFSLDQYIVQTEISTINQKRIDILISGTGRDENKYIIIENKIYHWLHNDLNDYWNHCQTMHENKVGIVLSLTPILIPSELSGKFINILHNELIDHYIKKIGAAQHPIYLKEFTNAIKNLYNDHHMNEEVKFYFQNLEACNRIYKIGNTAHEYVMNQIKIAGENMGLRADRKGEDHRCLYDPKTPAVYYTITFERIWTNEKMIYIYIELWKDGLRLLDKIEAATKNLALQYQLTMGGREYAGVWKHFAHKGYFITDEDLPNLSVFIEKVIKQDFEETFITIKDMIANSQYP